LSSLHQGHPPIPIASFEEDSTIHVVISMASIRLLQRWVIVSFLVGGAVGAAEIEFARDIQPILS
jgi:hypothetical protein